MQGIKVVIHYSFFEAALIFGAGVLVGQYLAEANKEKEPEQPPIVLVENKKKKRAIFDKLVVNLGRK